MREGRLGFGIKKMMSPVCNRVCMFNRQVSGREKIFFSVKRLWSLLLPPNHHHYHHDPLSPLQALELSFKSSRCSSSSLGATLMLPSF